MNESVYSFSSVTEETIKKTQNSVKILYRSPTVSEIISFVTISNCWKWLTNVSAIYQQLYIITKDPLSKLHIYLFINVTLYSGHISFVISLAIF